MARNKETLVVLVDVGPTMHQHLEYTSKTVSALVQRKLVHNKHDEVGIVFFGSDETENDLYAEQGGYENIFVARPISVLSDDLASLVDLPKGSGVSDFVDAVVVGVDMIYRKLGMNAKGNKRIFLITDAETFVKEPDTGTKEDQVVKIAGSINEHGVSLDVAVIRLRGSSNSLKSKASVENEFLLEKFASHTKGELVLADSYTSLLGSVRTRVISPSTLYRGDLELTPNMSVKVWVYKKISTERIPSMKIFSDKAPHADPLATHQVQLDTEYKSTLDLDVSIPPEQRIKAYKYGPQFVPISSKEEDALRFKTEKGLKLIGFTDTSNVPRQYYMKDTNVFVPEPGNSRAVLAVSCLVRALKETNKVAIVRCVWRAGQTSVVLGVLTPSPATEDDVCDCFYFNILPFSEDLREFPFPSFKDRVNQQPTITQQSAADALVRTMDLAPYSFEEILKAERTVNPVLQRFYQFLHLKYSNADADVPALDDALRRIVEPDQSFLQECESALHIFLKEFTLTHNLTRDKGRKFWQDGLEDAEAKEVGGLEQGEEVLQLEDGKPISLDSLTNKKVEQVGSLSPVQDFEAMLARRDSDEWVPKAINGMKKIIMDLLDSAYNGNTFPKAMACLIALRAGCVVQEEPLEFNSFLQEIARKSRGKRLDGFWQEIVSKDLTLISKDEAPDSEVTQVEAASFLSGKPSAGQISEGAPQEDVDEMEALFEDII